MKALSETVERWLANRPSYLTSIGRPLPLDWWAFQLTWGGIVFTGIARRWTPGLVGPGGACRRCNVCLASRDHCNMVVPILILPELLADFSPLDHGILFDGSEAR
jgi:hypothetical protein